MPLIRRFEVLAVKTEAVIGTEETLVAADVLANNFDIGVAVTMDFEPREGQGDFGHLPNVSGPQSAVVTFRTELTGDGAGGIPDWANTLFPACGYVPTALVFNGTSEAPGANVKTVTIGFFQDGLQKAIAGAAGTFVISGEAGKSVMINWTFTGKWINQTDSTILDPTLPTDLPLRFGSATFDLGAHTPCLMNATFDAGNNVVLRECHIDPTGFDSALITNRVPIITGDPEAVLVATEDLWGKWKAGTTTVVQSVITDTVDTVTIDATVQYQSINSGNRNDILTDEISAIVLADSMTITF